MASPWSRHHDAVVMIIKSLRVCRDSFATASVPRRSARCRRWASRQRLSAHRPQFAADCLSADVVSRAVGAHQDADDKMELRQSVMESEARDVIWTTRPWGQLSIMKRTNRSLGRRGREVVSGEAQESSLDQNDPELAIMLYVNSILCSYAIERSEVLPAPGLRSTYCSFGDLRARGDLRRHMGNLDRGQRLQLDAK